MKREISRKAKLAKWINSWMAILLLGSIAAPASVSAKSSPAGSRYRGTIQKIVDGAQHTLALKSDGTVVAWGSNGSGQSNVPAGLGGVVAISAGMNFSLALKSDGTVMAWGINDNSQINVPAGLSGVVAIAAGGYHSLALKADGTVAAWGNHWEGQTSVPAGLSGVVAVAAGSYHSLALKSDGTVMAWGKNDIGQTSVPAGLKGVVAIAAGFSHSLALRSDGTVVAWGANFYGQASVPAGLSDVVAVAAGTNHSLALKADGTVVAWGLNGFGQTNVPAGLGGVFAISAGDNHSLALKSDGTVVGWGFNGFGQSNVPAALTAPVKGKAIAAGAGDSLALKSDGTVAGWGFNSDGQASVPAGLTGVAAIAAGAGHSLALKSDGTVAAWGDNSQGQTDVPAGLSKVVSIAAGYDQSLALQADGTVVGWGNASVPGGLSGIVAIAAGMFHSLALKSDGTVVAWGDDSQGQTDVPPGLDGVVSIAAGMYHSLALKSDGTVVAWGDDSAGQSILPVALNSQVVAIAGGFVHSLALKSDGTVVAWGDNGHGQTNVPAGLNGVVSIAAGGFHSLALKADGTIVAWGENGSGQSAVPGGDADLSDLALQEGPFDASFSTSVTSYTYAYVGSSASSVHVSATLTNMSDSALYINNQPQTSGSVAEVGLSDASTVIPVRVEPYFLPSKTYTITVLRDSAPPNVHFSVNGNNAVPSQFANTVVTVEDTESGVDSHSLQYAWTQSAAVPSGGWTAFASGETLTKAGADGEWYLHIQAKDNAGNSVDLASNPFLLDNTGPSIHLAMTAADTNPYPDDTWTNQDVAVSANASDPNSVTSLAYSLDSGATWRDYTVPIVLKDDSIYALAFKAVDSLGNDTMARRTIKISKSGLKLTPALKKADGSVYTSGAWTNGSVTASVYAAAGASGLADLTYTLDGGSPQAYANDTPIAFEQEGMHTILFDAADTAGNSLTARLAVNIDLTAPSVRFGVNGSDSWAKRASTAVTVADSGGSGEAVSTLQYAWTTEATPPTSGWTAFANGTELTKVGADGDWYLHIRGQDAAGNTANARSNRFRLDNTAPVITLVGPPSMHVPAGSKYAEQGATATDAGGSGVAGPVAATGSVDTEVPGTYTLRYNVSDLAGNAAAEETRTVIVDERIPSTPAMTMPVIDINGKPLDPASIDTSKPYVVLEVQPKNGAAYVGIPAGILASFADKNAAFIMEIKTPYGSYRVPANLASQIPGLQEWLAKNNLLAGDVSFRIALTDKSGDKNIQAAFAKGLPDGKALGGPVDFQIDILNAKTGQALRAADSFSKALNRLLPLPKQTTGMPAQWGAFRYNETANEFEFVPAKTAQIDGVRYVLIRSYSDGTYVVAENKASFADMQKHWAKPFVESAAAKGLVKVGSGGRYDPDKAVTRAELTAMLVRALGRDAFADRSAPYEDVRQGAWYFEAIAAAKQLGLLEFASGSSFKPDQPVTREEMASMLASAVRVEQLPITDKDASLDAYKDIGSVNPDYMDDVRLMVALQIMSGTRADAFSPKGSTTRAQAAIVLVRTLKTLGMID